MLCWCYKCIVTTTWFLGLVRLPMKRISVVPSITPPQPQQSNGFPSPRRDYAAENQKFQRRLIWERLVVSGGKPYYTRLSPASKPSLGQQWSTTTTVSGGPAI